jgi:hypothetical protein
MQGLRVRKLLETVFVIPCVQMSYIVAVPTVPFPRASDTEHDVLIPSLTTSHDRETLRTAMK